MYQWQGLSPFQGLYHIGALNSNCHTIIFWLEWRLILIPCHSLKSSSILIFFIHKVKSGYVLHVKSWINVFIIFNKNISFFQLRDLNLGTHFPSIRNVEVKQLKLDASTGLMDDLELCLDLEYAGGFQLSIDANMRLAKTAYVSVKGKVKLNNSWIFLCIKELDDGISCYH